MKIRILGLLLAMSCGTAHAQNFLPELVEIPLTKAYIPMGFDSNDRVQVVVEGTLPDTCYRLGPTEVRYDEATNKVIVEQRAYLYRNNVCLMMVQIPFNKTVELGLMKHGKYAIVDGRSQTELGVLPVAEALNDGPDDFIYAIIEDAHIGVSETQRAVVVRGMIPSSCWSIKEMRVIVESNDVITILPIMKYAQKECSPSTLPLFTSVKLPTGLKKGRYMVQVRSLNGLSVNKLFDL